MITIEIKSLLSPDVEVDVWQPGSVGEVCFLLEAEIGQKGDETRDLFQVVVATPEGLRLLEPKERQVIADRATFVFAEFSWPDLHRALESILRRCESPTWNETVLRLQRYFHWEYEDYVQED